MSTNYRPVSIKLTLLLFLLIENFLGVTEHFLEINKNALKTSHWHFSRVSLFTIIYNLFLKCFFIESHWSKNSLTKNLHQKSSPRHLLLRNDDKDDDDDDDDDDNDGDDDENKDFDWFSWSGWLKLRQMISCIGWQIDKLDVFWHILLLVLFIYLFLPLALLHFC